MTIERELLKRFMTELKTEDDVVSLFNDIKECLAQPEEGVYQKLLRIEKENYVEMLPSELWLDGYEAGKKSALLSKQPEQEPVAWQLVANFITDGDIFQYTYSKPRAELYEYYRVTPLFASPPKRELLSDEAVCQILLKKEWRGFVELVRIIEKAHGIGGGNE